jgi:hypothetical protein
VAGIQRRARLEVELSDGCIDAEVHDVRTTRTDRTVEAKPKQPVPAAPPRSSKSRNGNSGQGSLFWKRIAERRARGNLSLLTERLPLAISVGARA